MVAVLSLVEMRKLVGQIGAHSQGLADGKNEPVASCVLKRLSRSESGSWARECSTGRQQAETSGL